jgi:abortive infection bacteriophage resistance protein
MKTAKTYEEQLEILEGRGLVIENKSEAIYYLSNFNYYNLTGYLYQFKTATGDYQEGTSFEQAVALYSFDKEIHNFLIGILTEIEQSLKTKIAYGIAMEHPRNPYIYENSDFFKTQQEHERFIKDFRRNVENNQGIEFVKHHKAEYQGKFPIWVAVQLFTMGNIKYLYKNLSNPLRKMISREFHVSPATMDNWIENIRIARNLAAHNIRLYGYTFKNTPRFSDLGITGNTTNRIFVVIHLMKYLYFDNIKWLEEMVKLQHIIAKYSKYVDLEKIGFPKDWFEVLTKQDIER